MAAYTPKHRPRRWWRRSLVTAEDFVTESGEQFDEDFLDRLGHLRAVWRFVAVWLLCFVLLAAGLLAQMMNLRGYYQAQQPVPGGIYSEGMAGTFTTANPLYALSDVDTSVSKLVFAGLLTYDGTGQLTADLADHWSANPEGTVYTVHLRPGLTWQDGRPLTAQDVVFTYHMIQNPDAQSPLQPSWKSVTVAATDSRTVTFTLPNPLSSFPYSLTVGIIPEHLLGSVDPSQLRSAAFNTNPVGAGPFAWSAIGLNGTGDAAEGQITFLPFKEYWAGPPKLNSFIIHTYATRDRLLAAYRRQEITAASGLGSLPPDIARDKSSRVYNIPLADGAYVFFKSSNPILGDTKVRQALVAAANRSAIISTLGYAAIPVDEPLLHGQVAYDPTFAQATDKAAQAKSLLDGDGWVPGADGIRMKNGQQLSFGLSVLSGSEYVSVARQLQAQWKAVGVDVKIVQQQPEVFQGSLAAHTYDAVLYGISIGVDPDVFVYWDSSQADIRSSRLNFAEYKSRAADTALEAGRTRLDNQLRTVKYRAFLQVWQQDAPALGLYQPRLLYISHIPVYGLNEHSIATAADRLDTVQDWMVHIDWVTQERQ